MMHTPRLPQEIVDQIIDHLHDDLSALAQCNLTNSSWLPSVRLHRYREVTITYKSAKGFQDLLEAVPEMGTYVQTLSVDFSFDDGIKLIYDTGMAPALHSMLPKLRSIQDLRLRRTPLPDPSIMPTTITSISIVEVWVDSPAVFPEWLARIPSIRSLVFTGMHRTSRDHDLREIDKDWSDVTALSVLQPLEALEEFSIFPDDHRMDWLLMRLVPSRLRVLSLCPASVRDLQDAPAVQAVLRGVGSALHTLEMSETFFSEYLAHHLQSLPFSQCDRLRTIRLGGCIGIFGERYVWSGLEWAIKFLRHLCAPNVTTVRFVLDPREDYYIDTLDWLGHIFADVEQHGSVLRILKRVVFEIGGNSYKKDSIARRWLKHYIRQAATRLHAKLSINDPSPGLVFEIAFLGHGVDFWPVTHARPMTVATFCLGQETITWHPGYDPDSET